MIDEVFTRYNVLRLYADPPYWESEIDAAAEKYGEKRVLRWYTYRTVQMHAAAERLLTDVTKSDSTFRHDGCGTTSVHMRNARKSARSGGRYVLAKASPTQKIDAVIPSILAQTFTDFEWILVDDGSEDRTPEILRDLAQRDSRVRIFSPRTPRPA